MNKQIPRNIVSILLLFIVLLFSAGTSNAQHYPVQCNVQLIPPYSVHLADYYQGSNQKLLVNLTLKDLNHADLSVRLRISIEGQGIKLITKDDFIPKAPVLLQAGTPELLYGDHLEEYLAPEHMNFSGITKKQFLKTGRLPEGVYKFTVEVFEARRQEKVSNTATSMAWMLLNEPPVITAPANNKLLKATDPASIFFNWLPRHMNSQNALADVEYEFTMVEIWPVNQSAEEAIRSKEPLLKTVFRNTSFVYDAQYPMLVPGRQYACRVRAFSSQQKEMFKNEGYSPVVSFVFGEECKPPLMVDVDPALGGSAQLSIVPQSNHSSFTVQIRDVAGDKWYSQQSNQPDFELKQLKPGAAYQYKVQAQCETLESEFTPISQFSLSKEQAEVECGQSAAIPEIDGSPALNQLTAGDVINAGGFKVTVKQASGSRGTFTGSGVVRIGMLGNIELRTVFDNIKVNESYQLTAGEIRVVGSDIYALGSDVRDQADDFFNNDIWDSVDDAIADAESIVDEISNLQTDMGDNSLNNELEKAKRTIEKGRDKLAVGNQKGAQLVKEGAEKVAQILDQVNSGDFQITANGIFFFAHSSQSYGFDSHDEGLTEEEKKAYLPYYQSLQLGDTTKQYYLKAWKSIGSNGNDVVNVKMQLSNGMKADTVHFMNAMGAEITPQKQGDAFSLNLRGSFHEDVQQITAYYNVKDDSTKKTKKVPLGALNVISYDQIEKNLVLVPVNGNSTSIPRAQLETYLNDTYSPANVRWTVSRHAGVQVEYSDDMSQGLDDGESKMLSNYTKEMNKVIKALKRSGDYDKHKTYVFLVDKAQTANKAGFMPKKRPWGFVFTNIHYNNSKALCRTIAHEVAHGEFRLSHPFQDFPSIPENSTQNLMDYADGQQLRKYQWDDIHNLRDVELWGQEEEGNAAVIEFPTCTRMELERFRAAYANGTSVSFSKDQGLGYSTDKIKLLDNKEYDVVGIKVSEDVNFWPHTVKPKVTIRNGYAYFDLGNGVVFFTSEDDYTNKGIKDYIFPDNEAKILDWDNQLTSLKESILTNLKEDNQSNLLKELAILPESETYRFEDKEKDEVRIYLDKVNSKPIWSCFEWIDIIKKMSTNGSNHLAGLSDDKIIENITVIIETQDTVQDVVEFYKNNPAGDIRPEGDDGDNYFVYNNGDVEVYANKYSEIGTELANTIETSFNILSYDGVIDLNIDFYDFKKEQLVLRFKTTDLNEFEKQIEDLGFDGGKMRKIMADKLWTNLYITKSKYEFHTILKYIPEVLTHDVKTKCIDIIYNDSEGKLTNDEFDIICSLIQNVNNSKDADKMVAWLGKNPQILDKLFSSIDDWSADKFSSVAEAILVLYYKQDRLDVITKGKKVNAANLFEWNPSGNTDKFKFDIPEDWGDYWDQAKDNQDNIYTISYASKYEDEKFVITPTYHFVAGTKNYPISYNPFETVSVYFSTDNKYIKAGGWTVPMPSIYLAWLINQGTRDTNNAMLNIGTTAVSMAFGIGELKLAIEGSKYLRLAITSTFMIKGINDLLLKSDLYQDEVRELLGPEFVEDYKNVSDIIDIMLISKTTISGDVEEKVNALATAWNKMDAYNLKQLEQKYPELYKLIGREIEKLKAIK